MTKLVVTEHPVLINLHQISKNYISITLPKTFSIMGKSVNFKIDTGISCNSERPFLIVPESRFVETYPLRFSVNPQIYSAGKSKITLHIDNLRNKDINLQKGLHIARIYGTDYSNITAQIFTGKHIHGVPQYEQLPIETY